MASHLVAFVCAIFLVITTVHAATWSYEGDTGPDYWKDDSPDCGGPQQSPINIDVGDVEYSPDLVPFVLGGYDQTADRVFTIENKGHTVQVDVSGTGTYDLTGGNLPHAYRLVQFHFHWGSDNTKGSEHTLDGAQYPMELHLVHYNSDDYGGVGDAVAEVEGLAVLGFFFEIGDSNTAFDNIVSNLEDMRFSGENQVIPTFSLMSLLPNTDRYFRYPGSLTTPGCFESVVWSVFVDTIKISQTQMDAFRGLFDGEVGAAANITMENNFRPVQPLGERIVYSSYYTGSSSATYISYSGLLMAAILVLLRVL